MHTHMPSETRKSGGEEGLRGRNGRSKRLGEGEWGPDRRTRGRKRRSRSGGRIRAAPCFLGTAPPSPVGLPSQTLPRHRTQHRTLGAASASGGCQGPKYTSPASSSAQVSLGSQGSPRVASEQMAEKSPKSGPGGSRGQAPAGDVPAASGLPRRETDWHEMDAVPSWTCLAGSKTGPQCSSCPYVIAPCPKGQGVPVLRKRTPGVGKPFRETDMWACHSCAHRLF